MSNTNSINKNPAFNIHDHAANTPEKIAIIDNIDNTERSFSYNTLKTRIDQLVGYLLSTDIKAEDRVAIISRNRIEIIETFIAAMQIGAIPFCLNPDMAVETIETVFKNSGPTCVFMELPCREPLMRFLKNSNTITLITIGQKVDGNVDYDSALNQNHAVDNNRLFHGDPSMLVYTSGSTGIPKGVLRKLSIFNMKYPFSMGGLDIYPARQDMANDTRIIPTPLFHANGLMAIQSLQEGSSAFLMRYFDPEFFVKLLGKYKITYCSLLPSMLALCLKNTTLIEQLDFSHLKLICLFGAPCATELMVRAKARFQCHICTDYSMTEGLPGLTFNGLKPEDIPLNSCGKAAPDAQIRLVDDNGKEGNHGEMWAKQFSKMSSYYNGSDIVAEKYHDGWFKTGDLFYRDDSGFYYYRGRKDDMFICDGENIYPLDIENVLCQHPAVLMACVTSVDHDISGQVPVAMVVCKPGCSTTQQELRNHFLDNSTLFAYPRIIHIADEIPTLGPGKFDRKKVKLILEQKYRDRSLNNANSNSQAPAGYSDTDVTNFVVEAFQKAALVEQVNLYDTIFDLGLNSIQVTLIAGKAREHFGVPVSIGNIFEWQTPYEISAQVKSMIEFKELANNNAKSTSAEKYVI